MTSTQQPPADPSPQWLRVRFRLTLLFMLLGYSAMCLLSCSLVLYLRRARRHAFSGDAHAARRVILPAFEPLLVVLAATTFVYSAYISTALATGIFEQRVSKLTTEVFYSGRQFVFLSVVVFILQTSVSRQALRRSLLITLVLATYTIPVVALLVTYAPHATYFYAVHTAARALLLLLYGYVFLRPPCRASKHTLREFCVYAFVYYALLFAYNDLFHRHQAAWGFLLTFANLVWGSLCPLVIWRVMQADTDHWRGLGQRAVALQQGLSSSSSGSSTATALRSHLLPAECISAHGHHVLIEMHRKHIVDFAYLQIQQRIGTASSGATVFRGVLKGTRDVAVKVYTPSVLDEITVAEFSQEAALCGALRHANIVEFVGLSVSPPTICMVSELCAGTLEDVTRILAERHLPSPHQRRQQTLIDLAYMVDAARAVAYLHSFTPPFLHRNINPSNFLVDGAFNTIKLTHFQDSRSLPLAGTAVSAHSSRESKLRSRVKAVVTTKTPVLSDTMRTEVDAELESCSPSASFRLSSLSLSALSNGDGVDVTKGKTMEEDRRLMTIKGSVEYMAPELLRGQADGHASYGEAADVYALAITMWDVLFPGLEKYPVASGNRLTIIDSVLNGERPQLLGGGIHSTLAELLTNAWHDDARLRPSAQHVVEILEGLQEELTAPFAAGIYDDLQRQRLLVRDGDRDIVSGEGLVHVLCGSGFVDSTAEAVRLGNALMDAGMIHHRTHQRPMEAKGDEQYYFDEAKIRGVSAFSWSVTGSQEEAVTSSKRLTSGDSMLLLPSWSSQPLTKKRSRHRSDHRVPSDPTEMLSGTGNCACRSFSQRLQQPQHTDDVFVREDTKHSIKLNTQRADDRQVVLVMETASEHETLARAMTIAELCNGPEDDRISQWDGSRQHGQQQVNVGRVAESEIKGREYNIV